MRIHGEFSVMYYCFGTWKSIAIFALCSVQSSFFFFPNAVEDEWDLKQYPRKQEISIESGCGRCSSCCQATTFANTTRSVVQVAAMYRKSMARAGNHDAKKQ